MITESTNLKKVTIDKIAYTKNVFGFIWKMDIVHLHFLKNADSFLKKLCKHFLIKPIKNTSLGFANF